MSDDHSPNWNVIVERHAERVFRIAYRIFGSVHDAEDVSQIVFIETLRVPADGPLQSWAMDTLEGGTAKMSETFWQLRIGHYLDVLWNRGASALVAFNVIGKRLLGFSQQEYAERDEAGYKQQARDSRCYRQRVKLNDGKHIIPFTIDTAGLDILCFQRNLCTSLTREKCT